jgi:hypothetical protein
LREILSAFGEDFDGVDVVGQVDVGLGNTRCHIFVQRSFVCYLTAMLDAPRFFMCGLDTMTLT